MHVFLLNIHPICMGHMWLYHWTFFHVKNSKICLVTSSKYKTDDVNLLVVGEMKIFTNSFHMQCNYPTKKCVGIYDILHRYCIILHWVLWCGVLVCIMTKSITIGFHIYLMSISKVSYWLSCHNMCLHLKRVSLYFDMQTFICASDSSVGISVAHCTNKGNPRAVCWTYKCKCMTFFGHCILILVRIFCWCWFNKAYIPTNLWIYHTIEICSGITRGRGLNGELYAQRLKRNLNHDSWSCRLMRNLHETACRQMQIN